MTVPRLKLWVVRHGETEDNKTRTIAGHNAGKLSALGVAQVDRISLIA
jgi:broad specificity phosphatase PhoE